MLFFFFYLLVNLKFSAFLPFQMCAKETRDTPVTEHASTTVAAPARFDSKPTFRQIHAKPELAK